VFAEDVSGDPDQPGAHHAGRFKVALALVAAEEYFLAKILGVGSFDEPTAKVAVHRTLMALDKQCKGGLIALLSGGEELVVGSRVGGGPVWGHGMAVVCCLRQSILTLVHGKPDGASGSTPEGIIEGRNGQDIATRSRVAAGRMSSFGRSVTDCNRASMVFYSPYRMAGNEIACCGLTADCPNLQMRLSGTDRRGI
jgi:hypothetical protein